jgi:hypothetical protein
MKNYTKYQILNIMNDAQNQVSLLLNVSKEQAVKVYQSKCEAEVSAQLGRHVEIVLDESKKILEVKVDGKNSISSPRIQRLVKSFEVHTSMIIKQSKDDMILGYLEDAQVAINKITNGVELTLNNGKIEANIYL